MVVFVLPCHSEPLGVRVEVEVEVEVVVQGRSGLFKKAVNSLLIVKEWTAVGAPAGPRGFVLCRARGPFSFVRVCETESGGSKDDCSIENQTYCPDGGFEPFQAPGALNLVSCPETQTLTGRLFYSLANFQSQKILFLN